MLKFTRIFKCYLIGMLILGGVLTAGCGDVPAASNTATPSPVQPAEPVATPSPEKTPEPKDSPGDLNVGICLNNARAFSGVEYLNGIESVFKAKGVKYEVFDANGDSNTQALQIMEAVKNTDALIVDTTGNPNVRKACDEAAKTLPLIFIEGLDTESIPQEMGVDESNALSVASKAFTKDIKSGKTMLLKVDAYANQQTEDALTDTLKSKGIEITAAKTALSFEEGADIISTWMMAYPDIKGIWAYSPEAADSALYMSDLASRHDIRIAALTFKPGHMQALKDGLLTVIIYPLYKESGVLAADAAIDAALFRINAPIVSSNLYKVYTQDSFKNSQSPIAVYPPVSGSNVESEIAG